MIPIKNLLENSQELHISTNDKIEPLSQLEKERLATLTLEEAAEFIGTDDIFRMGKLENSLYFALLRAKRLNEQKKEANGYHCEKCQNRGFIAKVRYEPLYNYYNDYYEWCDCRNIRACLRLIEQSGLSGIIKRYTLDKFKTDHSWQKFIKDSAVKYISEGYKDGKWFLISGNSGCGKTHICTAIVREFLKQAIPVKYMVWDCEVIELNANVNTEKYHDLIEPLKRVEVLYIDDLFKPIGINARPSDGEIKRAKEILDYRLRNNLVTVISTELSINEIIDIDAAVGGRIYQMTKGNSVHITGADKNYRLI